MPPESEPVHVLVKLDVTKAQYLLTEAKAALQEQKNQFERIRSPGGPQLISRHRRRTRRRRFRKVLRNAGAHGRRFDAALRKRRGDPRAAQSTGFFCEHHRSEQRAGNRGAQPLGVT